MALVVVVILAVDFAALDDITTGHETSFAMEWTWLAVSTALPGLLAGLALRRRRRL